MEVLIWSTEFPNSLVAFNTFFFENPSSSPDVMWLLCHNSFWSFFEGYIFAATSWCVFRLIFCSPILRGCHFQILQILPGFHWNLVPATKTPISNCLAHSFCICPTGIFHSPGPKQILCPPMPLECHLELPDSQSQKLGCHPTVFIWN